MRQDTDRKLKMPSQKRSTKKAPKSGFVIGRSAFEKISEVEGLKATAAMKKRARIAKRKKLSGEETRTLIMQSYRKG